MLLFQIENIVSCMALLIQWQMYLRICHGEKSVVKLECDLQSVGFWKSRSQVTIRKKGIIETGRALHQH